MHPSYQTQPSAAAALTQYLLKRTSCCHDFSMHDLAWHGTSALPVVPFEDSFIAWTCQVPDSSCWRDTLNFEVS